MNLTVIGHKINLRSNISRAALWIAVSLAGTTGFAKPTQFVDQGQSDPAAIFVPGDRVPLSKFKTVGGTGNPVLVQFDLPPGLLAWLVNNPGGSGYKGLEIASLAPGGSVNILPMPTNATDNGTTISFTVSPPAGLLTSFVVVSRKFKNQFPIVTHWSNSLNAGKGGFSLGASDDIGAPHPNCQTTVGYTFDDCKYNFDDGSGQPGVIDAKFAGYERKMNENHTFKLTDLDAINFSDWCRATTKYPIQNENGNSALYRHDWPIFQIIHAYHVYYQHHKQINGTCTEVPGREDSLATFILPPTWKSFPVPGEQQYYPVVLTSLYDLHGATTGFPGKETIKALEQFLTTKSKIAVGIVTNGGGANATLVMNESILMNVRKLFEEARSIIRADPERVIIHGGSRGGTAALALAANPIPIGGTQCSAHPWPSTVVKAKFVVASNPTLFPGQNLGCAVGPGFPLVTENIELASGFQGGWKPNATWPSTLPGYIPPFPSALDLAMETLFGSKDQAVLDGSFGNGADRFIDSLKANGTSVILRVGTHDIAKPIAHPIRYYAKLLQKNVPVRFEISHRFGHHYAVFTRSNVAPFLVEDSKPTLCELLDKVVLNQGLTTAEQGVFHLHSTQVEDEHENIASLFTPNATTMTLEAPHWMAYNQYATFTVAGLRNTPYEVWMHRIDSSIIYPAIPLNQSSTIVVSQPPSSFKLFESQNGLPDMTLSSTQTPVPQVFLSARSHQVIFAESATGCSAFPIPASSCESLCSAGQSASCVENQAPVVVPAGVYVLELRYKPSGSSTWVSASIVKLSPSQQTAPIGKSSVAAPLTPYIAPGTAAWGLSELLDSAAVLTVGSGYCAYVPCGPCAPAAYEPVQGIAELAGFTLGRGNGLATD